MCTLAIFLGSDARYPLIVAANRDEDARRPTRDPFLWPDPPGWIAGRDERAGGTWLGINAHGVLVGLTNLWTGEPVDAKRESRGDLVLDLLRCASLDEAARRCRGRDAGATNPAVLVCADWRGRGFWTSTFHELQPQSLTEGAHVLGNRLPEDPQDQKLDRARHEVTLAFARGRDAGWDEGWPLLAHALGHHHGERRPEESLCVHTGGDHGTVSASILLVGSRPVEGRFFYAAGPPCVTDFVDRSDLLTQLTAGGQVWA